MFYLDRNVIEIAKLCNKPLERVDETEGRSFSEIFFINPDGICFFTNGYFLIRYELPKELEVSSHQQSLFEEKDEFTNSYLAETVGIIGKEFANTCKFQSEMPNVGNYATIKRGENGMVDIFWSSGVSEQKVSHIWQKRDVPDFGNFEKSFVANGSKSCVSVNYLNNILSLAKKIDKSRNQCGSVTISIDNVSNRIFIVSQFLKITLAGLKTE